MRVNVSVSSGLNKHISGILMLATACAELTGVLKELGLPLLP